MKTLLTLALSLAGLASAQTSTTYLFNPGVACIAATDFRGHYQLINCGNEQNQITSAPNADGSTMVFFIKQANTYQPGTLTFTLVDASGTPTFYSGPMPVTVSPGLSPTITTSDLNGSFTFKVNGCFGGGRGNPGHCNLLSIGNPSGTLTVTVTQ